MFGTHDLALFIVSGLLLNVAPGPDSLYIIGRSASQGWRAGTAAAFGIGTGTLVHIFAAAFGLSAVLATSALAFTIVKVAGAAYLLYMGATMLLTRGGKQEVQTQQEMKPTPLRKIFMQGFLTNVLNPKVALFFLAFMSQFIDAAAPHKAWAFIFLGVIFDFNGMLWCNFLAWSAAHAGARLKGNAKVSRWSNRLTGGLFVGLGIKLFLSKQN